MRIYKALVASLLLSLVYFSALANVCIQPELKDSDHYTFKNKIQIASVDGVKISANLMTPKGFSPKSGWPTIIFANSWVLDENEYLVQAAKFAREGFQVLSYSMRGWGCSEGELEIFGPRDIEDVRSVVDWLRDNTNVDIKNIGMSGISYGGGMSLMAIAHDPRIKTVVAMSALGSLPMALYANETPRKFWIDALVGSADILATPSDEIEVMVTNLFNHRNIEEILEWAQIRSPVHYVDKINERNAPIYIANNFGDNLFSSNNVWSLFNKLTSPKRLELNQGAHATGELMGLFGADNYTWSNTLSWFNYYLRGVDTGDGISSKSTVTMLTDLDHYRESYTSEEIENLERKKFFLRPRKFLRPGKLLNKPYQNENVQNTISSRFDSNATTGIPLISALLDGNFSVPVISMFPDSIWTNGIAFHSQTFDKKLSIRGIPNLAINFKASSEKVQLISYLYHTNRFGYSRLITHGSITLHDAKKGVMNSMSFDLSAAAYDVPAGDRISIVIDTSDVLYLSPTDKTYKVKFLFDKEFQSVLELPIK